MSKVDGSEMIIYGQDDLKEYNKSKPIPASLTSYGKMGKEKTVDLFIFESTLDRDEHNAGSNDLEDTILPALDYAQAKIEKKVFKDDLQIVVYGNLKFNSEMNKWTWVALPNSWSYVDDNSYESITFPENYEEAMSTGSAVQHIKTLVKEEFANDLNKTLIDFDIPVKKLF